jgi:hypothetical protein
LVEVSGGFGKLLPHQISRRNAQGFPTGETVEIRDHRDLIGNVTPNNPVHPVADWPVTPVLPTGASGNQFVYLELDQPIDITSVLNSSPAGQVNGGLLGTIVVLAIDPATAVAVPIPGRAFIGGKSYFGVDPNNLPNLKLEQLVRLNDRGNLVAPLVNGTRPGLGFPFTESQATPRGFGKLASETVFVFVPDLDGNLLTHETFPLGKQIVLRATTGVLSTSGEPLAQNLRASADVGALGAPPEVVASIGPGGLVALTTPAQGTQNVDPETTVLVNFTEPVQPLSVGSLHSAGLPALSAAIRITFGPVSQASTMPFSVLPPNVFDLTVWELTPEYALPGKGPVFPCGDYNDVRVDFNLGQIEDLDGNVNMFPAASDFSIGEGPGLVNAPIAPDAIYAGRMGAVPGLSVVDLNGFGQSTGDPSFDFTYQTFPKGWSNFPNNPNLLFYGPNLHPPLFPGTCTANGGSSGVFTLTRDTRLSDLLFSAPLVSSIGDMALGHSLDLLYNNGKDTGGCQAGGGNFCAISGKKLIELAFQGSSTVGPTAPGQSTVVLAPGAANPISFAPHPNPPPLIFPALCLQPLIGGQEPTSSYSGTSPAAGGLGLTNLLVPGSPLGNPLSGIPPTGLLAAFQNTWFVGPDRASLPNASACFEHQFRQQIGHLLYVVDRTRREVVVLNSNRMYVLDRIQLADPTELAMGPNLDLLAVTNQSDDTVSFIDVDPTSSSFNTVVCEAGVGNGPRGVAWDPGNEDILVCNEGEGTLSVISALTLKERKRVGAGVLDQPFDVVITQRQSGFGFLRDVYFGWILGRSGDLHVFESGPSGANGWGYDDVIGAAPFTLKNPRRIAVDVEDLSGAVWVAHEDPLSSNGTPTGETGGALTRVHIDSAIVGSIPLIPGSSPQFRSMTVAVDVSIGESVLTGVPTDIAFDDQINFGALPNATTPFSAGPGLAINGKSQAKTLDDVTFLAAKSPRHVFVAVPASSEGPGVIDVLSLTSLMRIDTDAYFPGVQSIPAAGVTTVVDYWRQ